MPQASVRPVPGGLHGYRQCQNRPLPPGAQGQELPNSRSWSSRLSPIVTTTNPGRPRNAAAFQWRPRRQGQQTPPPDDHHRGQPRACAAVSRCSALAAYPPVQRSLFESGQRQRHQPIRVDQRQPGQRVGIDIVALRMPDRKRRRSAAFWLDTRNTVCPRAVKNTAIGSHARPVGSIATSSQVPSGAPANAGLPPGYQ